MGNTIAITDSVILVMLCSLVDVDLMDVEYAQVLHF